LVGETSTEAPPPREGHNPSLEERKTLTAGLALTRLRAGDRVDSSSKRSPSLADDVVVGRAWPEWGRVAVVGGFVDTWANVALRLGWFVGAVMLCNWEV
jgi:hypothetical protein